MVGSILGNAVRRVEDPALLRGAASYVGNLIVDGMHHLAFVRSDFAHANVVSVDVDEAAKMAGVVKVYTGGTIGLAPIPQPLWSLNANCVRHVLATDRVRYVGEPLVAIVATSRRAAVDAAAAVVVEYEALPVVVDAESALAEGAFLQFDTVPSNLVASSWAGDLGALDGAEVVVRGRFVNQRLAVAPMEGNAIAAIPGEPMVIRVSTQMPHYFAFAVASYFELAPDSLRVIAPDVGGAFGSKVGLNPEQAITIHAARDLDLPVTWIETRSENMVSMLHGRGQVQYVELGLRRSGEIVGLSCRMVADSGAYGGFGGYLPMNQTRIMATGVYRIPKVRYDVAVALTNTTPLGGLRGAGRPEATSMIERLVDLAAAELEIDPVELRRRNMLRADEFPYATPTGALYDSGDYSASLDAALEAAGYHDLLAEQRARIERGDVVLLGIGVCTYVEITVGGGGGSEDASVTIEADGSATIVAGTSAHGQGHATTFGMLVADRLGIPLSSIHFVQSDTGLVPMGGGTGGSRSLQLGGSAVDQAATALYQQARDLAAEDLEAAVDDIELNLAGAFQVRGVPASSRTWSDLHALASSRGESLAEAATFKQAEATYPFGAHVAVVEVDTETGRVRLIRHIAVDDCGRIVNPLIVQGQQHGGIAQGASQALWEHFEYDSSGNPVTSTFAEYAVPSAAELPSFEVSNTETTTPLNALGVKGIGESGTVGATPAVQNAVINAVQHLGIRHIDMPCTPERVWRAIDDARRGTLAPVWREPPAVFERVREIPKETQEAPEVEPAL